MKKITKFIGLAFFGLVALAFLIATIDSLVNLGDLIDVLKSDYIEGYPKFLTFLGWAVGLAGSIILLVIAVLALLKLVKNLNDEESHFDLKGTIAVAGVYACVTVVNFIITVLFVAYYESSISGSSIVSLIFALATIALLACAVLVKNGNKLVPVCTLLGAYLAVFVLICVAFSGAGGAYLASLIFFMLAVLTAFAYISLENVELFKTLTTNNNNTSKPAEEKKEETPAEEDKAE